MQEIPKHENQNILDILYAATNYVHQSSQHKKSHKDNYLRKNFECEKILNYAPNDNTTVTDKSDFMLYE